MTSDSRTGPASEQFVTRRSSLVTRHSSLVILLACFAGGCREPQGDKELVARTDRSLARGARFLVSKQLPDGAWRSEVYGGLKDGATLTPPILKAFAYLPNPDTETRAALRKGVSYLMSWIGADGRIRSDGSELPFPVYTAALASMVVDMESQDPAHERARSAWFHHLLQYRLSGSLGWKPEDSAFGGWGYAVHVPKKAGPGESPYESNLSATIFGIGALRHAGVALDDPIYREVRSFVARCQNFPEEGKDADPRFDDGGFFFTSSDPARNKAGIAGTDSLGRVRYNSYGSATADGLRALIRCGLAPDHPRVEAARRWLETHFSATSNPGRFTEDREVLRDATYYYYCWSVGHALTALGAQKTSVNWARALAESLVRQQSSNGAWANAYTDAKEDDPLVATPLAVAALAHCRWTLSGERPPPLNDK